MSDISLSVIGSVLNGYTYISLDEANTYVTNNLISNSDVWTDATNTNKLRALFTATSFIDRLNFIGNRISMDQPLQFPRENIGTPNNIKYATVHIAIRLLDDIDTDIEYENLALISQGYANVRSTHDTSMPREHIVAGIPSIEAWRLLQPYISRRNSVGLERVS